MQVIGSVGQAGADWAPTIILPRNPNPLLSWWEADTIEPVIVRGRGFDVTNGIAASLFCVCPAGRAGPLFFNPGNPNFDANRIILKLPLTDGGAPSVGSGMLVVRNKGADGTYAQASNQVWVSIGEPIEVKRVYQSGALITVEGAGFSTATVINLYCGKPVSNLGGFDTVEKPKIPLEIDGDSRIRLKVPHGAPPGQCYLEALNPPFLPFSSSYDDPGGAHHSPVAGYILIQYSLRQPDRRIRHPPLRQLRPNPLPDAMRPVTKRSSCPNRLRSILAAGRSMREARGAEVLRVHELTGLPLEMLLRG